MRARSLYVGSFSALLGSIALVLPSWADCSSSDGFTVTCTDETGPQTFQTIYQGMVVTDAPSETIGPFSLQWFGANATGNGQPGDDTPDLSMSYDGSGSTMDEIDDLLNTGALVGIEVISQAGAGSNGDHDTKSSGDAQSDDGGLGGSAGGASLIYSGGTVDVFVSDPDYSVILLGAASVAGNAGQSNEAHSETGGTARGGLGGGGGAANAVSIVISSGSLTLESFVSGPQYFIATATSAGGAGGAGGQAVAGFGDSHGGDADIGGVGGDASITLGTATLALSGMAGAAVAATSTGGAGGNGGDAHSEDGGDAFGGNGGNGSVSGNASAALGSSTITAQFGVSAVTVLSQGGQGGNGGEGHAEFGNGEGGTGGDGGAAGGASVVHGSADITVDAGMHGILVQSLGGTGGTGGFGEIDDAGATATGGDGGTGGNGGDISVTTGGDVVSISMQSPTNTQHAVRLESIAGQGGDGGNATSHLIGNSNGGDGGQGGTGGEVNADIAAHISTAGPVSQGIIARSYGGAGGDGGSADSLAGHGSGGAGAGSGPGGDVTVSFAGDITTAGSESNGILAQSVGGFAGDGGGASGFVAYGAGSESAGDAGQVSVALGTGTQISTSGNFAYALQAHSIGGGGGRGGSGDGLVGLGGSGSAGGSGESVGVTVASGSLLQTAGDNAVGVHAASIGGGGGDGGAAGGVVALGGSAGTGGDGGDVTLTHNGTTGTQGDGAHGIVAMSVGGGGGSAHSTVGLAAIGGSGGDGGDGGTVAVNNAGIVTTKGDDADAVFAQSVGGGGGKGSSAYAFSEGLSFSIGGGGGTGNDAGDVTYTDTGQAGRTISTEGDRSRGVFLQSVGGGGGDGGNAISVNGVDPATIGFSLGGDGGSAGDGGVVKYLQGVAAISTEGDHASAIQAQSIGGGGGNGGNAITAGAAAAISFGVSIGGDGQSGGKGGAVTVSGTGALKTAGVASAGIHAQSIGGGGGNGGTSVSGNGFAFASIDLALGGAGGDGGAADKVTVEWSDTIGTGGDNSAGILAQSIGGGGGSAGTTVAAAVQSQASVQVSVGGSGGSGGTSEAVSVTQTGAVTTEGDISAGVLAQSIGGGGGHSGTTLAGTWSSWASLSTSVGGSGGSGGNAGTVTANVGSITTKGDSSSAVSAMSIGGGGGSAHVTGAFDGTSNASMNVAVGGSGGAGGDGSEVTVSLDGALDTTGHNAAAIKAMSIGGGGGDSGMTVTGSLSGGVPVGVSVGGDGGSSGSGGAVSVSTTAGSTIRTSGDLSEGLIAASIARSGGSAGHVVSADGFSGGDANVDVGGHGGGGGDAGTVMVDNVASIITAGDFSSAIEARSMGGGGGSAKASINASALSMGDAAVTVGGKGGAGGNGGDVTVGSNATLGTGGVFAYGILAQSAGGAGGNGGFAVEASATGGEISGQLGVSVGGSGGDGGMAGTVGVTASGSISTGDYGAIGILAQSIGGAGGAGGSVYSGNLSASSQGSATIDFNIGGEGGGGARGGTTDVTNAASIATDGFYADGILAQSIGGNGGKGGSVYSILTTYQPGGALNFNMDIGGSGGTGAHADIVNVINSGSITTAKGGSDGIAAMSVGGGGGKGGAAANINASPIPGGTGGEFTGNVNIGIGGSGGAGGDGAAVTVKNTGNILSVDDHSRGVYAVSVGGGGGDGGAASSASYSFNGVCSALTGGAGYGCKPSQDAPEEETTTVQLSLTVEIGGTGAAGGNGGAVSVTNDAAIATAGHLSHGIVAHSIGGGGGDGGYGGLGIKAWTDNATADWAAKLPGTFTFIPNFTNISAGVGGSGGSAGDGGDVSVDGSGGIATQGAHAFGVHAQSIGGGGGNGGAGSTGLWSEVTVGGRGSGGGDGGKVTVDLTGGIATSGKGGVGIFAQSVGGGGGTAGDVELGWTAKWADLNIGAGVGVQQNPGGGGDGGDVTVTSAAITTTGEHAHGIIAQSVGGSGGIASISGDLAVAGLGMYAGGNGDAGNGGNIIVSNNGAISVSGAGAHGIIAQSTVGRTGQGDLAGDVTINVNANVRASGTGGRGILAQSQGDPNGAITINVAAGTTVSTAADGAETIGLFDGTGNSIVNFGTIRHEGDEATDYVIRTNGSALSVTNNGVIEGSVLTEFRNGDTGNAIAFTNASGATFGMGASVDLGLLGFLSNAGTMSAGTVGTIGQTIFNGTLSQTTDGMFAVDFVFGGAHDLVTVANGSPLPELAGSVLPKSQGVAPAGGTTGRFTFLQSDVGISSNTLTVASTATVDYSLVQHNPATGGQAIDLTYSIDYTPWSGNSSSKVPPSLMNQITQNHTRFGEHIDELVAFRQSAPDDSNAFIDDLVHSLLGVEAVEDLLDVYSTFAPPELFAAGETTLYSSLRFADSLMSCPANGASGLVFTREGSCSWLQAIGASNDRDADGYTLGYDADVAGVYGGAQAQIGEGWFAGFALGSEWTDLEAHRLSGTGASFHAGVSLKYEYDATTLAGALSGGFGSFDMQRDILAPEGVIHAEGDPDITWLSAHARIAHVFAVTDDSYIKPWFDAGIIHLRQDAYTESDAGPYGLHVGAMDNTFYTLNPAADFGTKFDIGGMSAEVALSAGMLAILGDTDWSASLQLSGVDSSGPSYKVVDDGGGTFAQLGATIKAELSENTSLEAGGSALFNSDQQQYTGTAKLMVSF